MFSLKIFSYLRVLEALNLRFGNFIHSALCQGFDCTSGHGGDHHGACVEEREKSLGETGNKRDPKARHLKKIYFILKLNVCELMCVSM